ncbi:MAG: hypothetical protein AVDCRST_MAG93-2909 [uncultured Chloroflexia bacterium]|uniref:Uncharacterized protein n=1 Tax=uncultured Chloroflexia bacterium TaxID=1672391 RepID=A0A6J4JH61_9CHLR|nr:MAG: hypothetical protein AVDCRST_MAG93-2909 [uncultured Chloroflexia bacterium]
MNIGAAAERVNVRFPPIADIARARSLMSRLMHGGGHDWDTGQVLR